MEPPSAHCRQPTIMYSSLALGCSQISNTSAIASPSMPAAERTAGSKVKVCSRMLLEKRARTQGGLAPLYLNSYQTSSRRKASA